VWTVAAKITGGQKAELCPAKPPRKYVELVSVWFDVCENSKVGLSCFGISIFLHVFRILPEEVPETNLKRFMRTTAIRTRTPIQTSDPLQSFSSSLHLHTPHAYEHLSNISSSCHRILLFPEFIFLPQDSKCFVPYCSSSPIADS